MQQVALFALFDLMRLILGCLLLLNDLLPSLVLGGGTVAGGTLRFFNDAVADSSTYSPNKGYAKPLGQYDLVVRVEAGAFYDINGVYDNNCYPVVLAGGALTSSKMQMKW